MVFAYFCASYVFFCYQFYGSSQETAETAKEPKFIEVESQAAPGK